MRNDFHSQLAPSANGETTGNFQIPRPCLSAIHIGPQHQPRSFCQGESARNFVVTGAARRVGFAIEGLVSGISGMVNGRLE
jgi:hypothetical protein